MDIFSDMGELFRALFALLIVVALMGGLALAIKRLGLAGAEPLAQLIKILKMTLKCISKLVLLR